MAENVMREDDEKVVEGTEPNERVEIELTEEEAKALPEEREDDRAAVQVDDEESDREAIRERRRLEKKERKERRDRAINRDKIELEFLRKRNEDLERRITGIETRTQKSDVAILEQKLREAANEVSLAEQVIAKAVAGGNGEDVTKAMRYRDQAMVKVRQIEQAKTQAAAPPPEPKKTVDDVTLAYAREFIEDNPWYDPNGKDESSAIVLAIDSALVKEGHDPRSEDYWDELRDRVRRRLPEKFEKSERQEAKPAERQARGGPPVGSGREHAPASTRREVYISPERKAALMEAGVWDDPVLRQKYIKKYMEYDRQRS